MIDDEEFGRCGMGVFSMRMGRRKVRRYFSGGMAIGIGLTKT